MMRALQVSLLMLCVLLGKTGLAQCNLKLTATTTDVSCYNGSNGTITCKATGASNGHYEYSFSTPTAPAWISNPILTGFSAGTYVINARDADNPSCMASVQVTITQPTAVTVTPTSTNTTCSNTSDGSVSVVATGGNSGYTYAWTKNGSPFAGTSPSNNTLSPGVYNVIATDSKGCQGQITSTATSYIPLALAGLTTDVVGDGSTSSSFNQLDNNGDAFFSKSSTTGSLPSSNQFVSSVAPNVAFSLASYTGYNSLRIAPGQTGIISFNGDKYSTLYVLATTGSGSSDLQYDATGGTSFNTTNQFNVPDWIDNGSNSAIVALTGLKRQYSGGILSETGVFALYQQPINLTLGSTTSQVNFKNTGAGYANIMAITGAISGTGVAVSAGAGATPTVTVTSNPGSTYCASGAENFQFTATVSGAGTNPSLAWSATSGLNLGTNSTSGSTSVNTGTTAANPTGTKTITVTVTPAAGLTCLTGTFTGSTSLTRSTAAVTPAVSISASKATVCPGENVVYTATPTNGGYSPTYTWTVDGTQMQPSPSNTYSTSYTNTGTSSSNKPVSVSLASNIGCGVATGQTSNTATTVNPNTNPAVTISGWQVPGPSTYQLQIKTQQDLGTPPTSYQWYRNNVAISPNGNSSTYTASNVTNTDVFSLLVTSSLSCPVASSSVMSNYASMAYVLPIQMLSFSVSNNRNVVNVHWQTAMEVNVKNFEVQRADQSNPNAFVTIGTVAAKNTQGNTYDYPDNVVGNGTYYYRIKSVDFDGQYELSNVQSVSINGTNSALAISPNPVVSTAILSGIEAGSTVMILDMSGQILRTEITNNTTYAVNASGLPSGMYIVRTVNKTGSVKTIRFLKK